MIHILRSSQVQKAISPFSTRPKILMADPAPIPNYKKNARAATEMLPDATIRITEP
jgi:hypothetical protein